MFKEKFIILIILLFFINSCSYIGNYTIVHFYKYNKIQDISTYSIVFDDSIDNYANYYYLQVANLIRNNLNQLGYKEEVDATLSDYIVYYKYDIDDYRYFLEIKIFSNNENSTVFSPSTSVIYKKPKLLFDSLSVLYINSSYLHEEYIYCLVQAIFFKQKSKRESIFINDRVFDDELNITSSKGNYYCIRKFN